MLKLSRKIEYALIALLHMGGLQPRELVSSRELAELYEIPADVLGKVLQALGRAGLINSIQGAKGGYYLARGLAGITLGDVVEAIEGPPHVVPCTTGDHDCPQHDNCNIRSPVISLQDKLLGFVYGITLQTIKDDTYDPMLINAEDTSWLPLKTIPQKT